MTDEQQSLAKKLRNDEGLSYAKIAKRIGGVSESSIMKFFKPKPKPAVPQKQPDRKSQPAGLLPRILHHGSCPIRKLDPILHYNRPSPSREELYQQLAAAVRNTVRLHR
jgi:hypothetical protein